MNIFPKTLLILGSGELGKEFVIAAQRIGCKVIACDRYENAPGMQVADIRKVLDMNNKESLMEVIEFYKPDLIIPEIEALAVEGLIELEKKGFNVIPSAEATAITMNRDKIRDLASIELGLKTAKYAYASSQEELKQIGETIGFPLLIKPVMSSSGKGQSLVKNSDDLYKAWDIAMQEARGISKRIIAEEFINFEQEITLLTIRERNGSTLFCEPIGHEQSGGDYQCSWQPANINKKHLEKAQEMAKIVTNRLGGSGIFGVEFFISEDEVIFSELSPRPHDTGLVTIISQNINEFELHLRAILGIPIPDIKTNKAAASRVILAEDSFSNVGYKGLDKGLKESDTKILLFGKPFARKGRRMGVALAKGETIKAARAKADVAANSIEVVDLLANDSR